MPIMCQVSCSHAVSRGFDHLPAYIAAKIASKGRKRLGSSPGKSRLKGQDLEMAMHTSRRSRFTRYTILI